MKSKSTKKFKNNKAFRTYFTFSSILIFCLIISVSFLIVFKALQNIKIYLNNYVKNQTSQTKTQITPTPTPKITVPQIKVSYRYEKAPIITPQPAKEWGIAKQIGEYTWTMNVGEDERMATPKEILEALNNYRSIHNAGTLNWDDKLAQYAQSRADYFASIRKTDAHAGFKDFLENQDGFIKLDFGSVGENSSFGYKLLGVHLIEWVFAGDKPHNDNQLNPDWTDVGIGVNQTGVNIIFAQNRL